MGASSSVVNRVAGYVALPRDRLDPEIVPRDFDPGYGDAPPDSATLEDDLFGDLIGCDAIKIQLKRIRSTFVHAEKVGRDPREVSALKRFLPLH